MDNTTIEEIVKMMDYEMDLIHEDLHEAKMELADVTMDDGDYQCKMDKKIACKEFEAQRKIVARLKEKIQSMMSGVSMSSPALARMA
ncbi:hypothetical protein II906_11925 [bacterium]|nr:hypothetical protein [bacterium]